MPPDPPPRLDERRLRATDHGRSEGWDVELDGRVVAFLDEPCFEDMFWISYRLTPTTDDPALAALLLSEDFWRRSPRPGLRYRSRALGLFAPHAFHAIDPFVEPGRLNMRGLYLTLETATSASGSDEAAQTLEAARPSGCFARLRSWLAGRRRGAAP